MNGLKKKVLGIVRGGDDDPASDWVVFMPWINIVLAGLVAIFSVNATRENDALLIGTLLALVAGMVVWFIRAFTWALPAANHPLNPLYRRQIFIFAYAFTFISFIVVMMPAPSIFEIDPMDKKLNPISIFYGCFDYGVKYLDTPSPRCELDREEADASKASKQAVPSADPSSRQKNGASDANKGNKDAGAADAVQKTDSSTAASVQDGKADPATRERSYALLLALGGSARQERANKGPDNQTVYAVSGGLVMPLYIVLVAMMGGAISLSRRIPEIQKRAEPDFPGTPDQSRLELFEAREQVVFQIMQLVAAPFIAICSFHMFEPKGLPTVVGLAFGSGFASETILLIIRGIVDGIRPGVPKTVANSQAQKLAAASAKTPATTTLTGRVIGKDKAMIANATIWVDGVSTRTKSDARGKFALSGVPVGATVLHGQAPDGVRQGALKLTVAANATATLILS